MEYKSRVKEKISRIALFFVLSLSIVHFQLSIVNSVYAQAFNIASSYDIADKDAVSGDIIISNGATGLTRTDVSYNNKIFGVLNDKPVAVIREASGSARPIIRLGDTVVNVTDFNGPIKKGDFITTSPVKGKGMKATLSGYVVGLALEDANLSGNPTNVSGKQIRTGTIKVALRIEFAELSTARNSIQLLDQLNATLFKNISDPEKFPNLLRYVLAGFIGLLAFGIGFFFISRSISKAVEAIGRNPLARTAIFISLIIQVVVALIGAAIALGIIYFLVK